MPIRMVINPGSVMLSRVMLSNSGLGEAAKLIENAPENHWPEVRTYDFERQMPGATKAKTSEFATRMIENMG